MATKPFVSVSFLMHGFEDTPFEVSDYVDDNDRFINIGTQVAAELARHDAVHFADSEGVEYYIPYHAISFVYPAKENGEYPVPEDAFCQPPECPAWGCEETHSNRVDEAIVDEAEAG